MRQRAQVGLFILLVLAPVSLLFSLVIGSVHTGWHEIWQALTETEPNLHRTLIWELRWPRSASAFTVGGLLALGGALMQVLLHNPLADPYVLGVSGGAALAALTAMLLGLNGIWITGGAFGGALLSLVLVLGLARGRGALAPERLLLTGVMIAAGWGALISVLLTVTPAQQLPGMLFWLIGDLGQQPNPLPAFIVLVSGLASCLPRARGLNLLASGDLQASALGLALVPLRVQIYLIASLLTATAVTLAGSIGFVGLIVPHLWRLLAGYDHRWLLPASVLLGGSLLVLADTLARTVVAPQQLPVGALTAVLGVPVFLHLLHHRG